MNEQYVLDLFERLIKDAGSMRALAKRWSMSPAYLCDIRYKRRLLSDTVLENMGLEKQVIYKVSYRKAAP